MNFLIINFNKTTLNQMFLFLLAPSDGDNLIKSSGNNTSTILTIIRSHHGVSFSTPCLPVSKDGSIVSIDDTIHEGKSGLLIDVIIKLLFFLEYFIRFHFIIFSKRIWGIISIKLLNKEITVLRRN